MKGAFMALALIASPLAAQQSVAPSLANQQLSDPAAEAKAMALMETLRCVQCQGQSIADSDAPIAAAMRAEVRKRISAGENPDSIRQWMIGRYGEWVSYQPAWHGAGLLLWFAPLLIFALGLYLARGLFVRGKP